MLFHVPDLMSFVHVHDAVAIFFYYNSPRKLAEVMRPKCIYDGKKIP